MFTNWNRPLGATMFAPAVHQVMDEFANSNPITASLTVSIYVLGWALGPLVLSSFVGGARSLDRLYHLECPLCYLHRRMCHVVRLDDADCVPVPGRLRGINTHDNRRWDHFRPGAAPGKRLRPLHLYLGTCPWALRRPCHGWSLGRFCGMEMDFLDTGNRRMYFLPVHSLFEKMT